MQSSLERAQQAISHAWEQNFDVFNHYQEVHRSNLHPEETESLTSSVTNQVEFSSHRMGGAFETVLNYVSGSFEEIEKMERGKRDERFAQLLGCTATTTKQTEYGKYALGEFVGYLSELMMAVAHTVLTAEPCLDIDSDKY